MRALVWIVAWGSLLFLIPAQAQNADRAAKRSTMTLQTGEACDGITTAECCEQKVELAGLRAQGDYPSRVIKTTVKLACSSADRQVAPQVCRSIALSRGFALNDAEALCQPAARDCKKNVACRDCVRELSRLSYQGSHNACHAVTFVPDKSGTKVVKLGGSREGEPANGDAFEIRKRTRVQ